MKSIVFLFLVGFIAAAEVDFRHRSNNINAGRPIRVPVVPSQRAATVQQKRQVDYDPSSVRPNSAATARQQTPSGVPLQQPFRQPQSQANFRRPQAEKPQQVAEQNNQNSQRPNGNLASFVPPTSSEQLFTSLRDSSETPARQVQRPNRPAAANVERPARNPEFNSGFPSGFTSGLPSFDFQGRMPEPDGKSDGFMDGVLNNFPNLKSLGGFDAFPDSPRDDSNFDVPAKKQQGFGPGSRPNPNRSNAQKARRRRAVDNQTVTNSRTERRLRNKIRPSVSLVADDEAMLEPDLPSPVKRSSNKLPTDIADIISDSVGSEQRFNPSFYPNNGPYGQYAPYTSTNSPLPPARSRRPSLTSIGAGPSYKNRPNNNRQQYPSQVEFVDDNSLLGSGNFDVLGGGVFRDGNNYKPYTNNYNQQYYPPSPPAPETYHPQQPYYSPPSQQLGHFAPQQSPIQHQSPINYNEPNYPTSFFDDDFFSNFRDFADVNQDYRN